MNLLAVLKKNARLYFSLAVLAAFLPLLLIGVLSRERLLVATRADNQPMLRVWLEPGSVISRPGQEIIFRMMGEYSGANRPSIPLTLRLTGESQLLIEPQTIVVEGWLGRKELAKVKVVPTETGQFEVFPEVGVLDSSLPDVQLAIQPGKLSVR